MTCLPPPYEQIGSGSEVGFHRSQSGIRMTEEEALRWLGENWRD